MYRKRDRILIFFSRLSFPIAGNEINSTRLLINWWISESANKIEGFLIASDYSAARPEEHFNFMTFLSVVREIEGADLEDGGMWS